MTSVKSDLEASLDLVASKAELAGDRCYLLGFSFGEVRWKRRMKKTSSSGNPKLERDGRNGRRQLG
jgi:hypothetical protein